jgi:hypothetical protein
MRWRWTWRTPDLHPENPTQERWADLLVTTEEPTVEVVRGAAPLLTPGQAHRAPRKTRECGDMR